MSHPGGNATGITSLDTQQAAKQFELLKEALPRISRVAILSDDTLPGADASGFVPGTIGFYLSGVIAAAIIFIGCRFLLAPSIAAVAGSQHLSLM